MGVGAAIANGCHYSLVMAVRPSAPLLISSIITVTVINISDISYFSVNPGSPGKGCVHV